MPEVTRTDVARRAGVSTAVVSYVVNDGPKAVRPTTRAKVLRAIEELGYRPNAAARALKRRTQEIFGLVLSSGKDPMLELSNTIEDAAREVGFVVILTNSRSRRSAEKENLRTLVARRVDGIFLASVDPRPDLSDLRRSPVPVVLLEHSTPDPGFSSVGPDLQDVGYRGTSHLIEVHGHRTVGMVGGPPGSGDDLVLGWRRAIADHGATAGPLITEAAFRFGGYRAGVALRESAERPSALFVAGDFQAVGVLRALHEVGLTSPADVAIVSYGGSPETEYTWPQLTTLKPPTAAMAKDAVATLLSRLGGDSEPVHRTYRAALVARESCGCGITTTPPSMWGERGAEL